jgi:hypothetical protein
MQENIGRLAGYSFGEEKGVIMAESIKKMLAR